MRKIALIASTATIVAVYDAIVYRRYVTKLHARFNEHAKQQCRNAWRDGYVKGFTKADKMLGYPIPADRFPKFADLA